MSRFIRAVHLTGWLVLVPSFALGGKFICPDSLDDAQSRDVLATSSPEVKVRANVQDDGKRWVEVVKPLTTKALKLAKAQRATLIQEGIEKACSSSQQYVGRIVPVLDRSSGCEQKTVTRPADDDHIWVQVVAICKYDWACCTSESLPGAVGAAVGYTLDGPLNPNPAPPPPKK